MKSAIETHREPGVSAVYGHRFFSAISVLSCAGRFADARRPEWRFRPPASKGEDGGEKVEGCSEPPRKGYHEAESWEELRRCRRKVGRIR